MEGGFAYYNDCNTFLQEDKYPTCRVFQLTANELQWEHQNYMKTHFHDHKENLHTAVLSNLSFAQNTFFNEQAVFIQGAFKSI